MFNNYIKIGLRNLRKNKMLSMLNLIGLTIGLSCIMSQMFAVYSYYNAESAFQNKEELYYLKTHTVNGDVLAQTPYPLLDELVRSSPDVMAATQAIGWNAPWLQYNEREFQENATYVNTDFLKVFTLPLQHGNPETALQKKYSIVLTAEASQRIFGVENPVGKTLVAEDSLSLTVTGVLAPISPYASLRLGVLMTTELLNDDANFRESVATSWYNTSSVAFLRLSPTTDLAKFEAQVMDIVAAKYVDPSTVKSIKLAPYSNIRDDLAPMSKVIIRGAIGTAIFVLLIVLVNLLNLNASIMYARTKEIAVRKVLGGGKKGVLIQFFVENALLIFTALLIAGLLYVTVLFDALNDIFGASYGRIQLNPKQNYPVIFYYLGLGFLITLIVSILPAMRFIVLPITTAIKGKIDATKGNFFVRNAFITLQFALAILFICVAIILNSQIGFMKNSPLGFNEKNVVVAKLNLEYKNKEAAASYFNIIADKLKANPHVLGFSTSRMVPSDYTFNYNTFYDADTKAEVRIRWAHADAAYLKTFEIPLVMGRDFDESLKATEENSVIINQKAMKALGWKDIENKTLIGKGESEKTYKVIGVMKDFHYQSMQAGIQPIIHYYGGKRGLGNNRYLSLRIAEGQEKNVLASLESDFKKIPTRKEFLPEELSYKISDQYALIGGILKIINFVAFMTIFISCLGMFGLISLMAKRRVKEIGIRKVLGAGVAKIVTLLSKDFIVLVVLAAIIAFPLAWWLMKSWLDSFAYSIDITWWMLGLGGLIAFLVTGLTVGIQALKAAHANPVKSLQTE